MQADRRFPTAIAALAASLFLAITAGPAAAQEQPAPGTNARQAWDSGFYYLIDFNLGDAENPNTDADFSVDLDWSTGFGFGMGYRMGPVRLEGDFNTQFYRVGSLDLGPASPFAAADYAGAMRTGNLMANLYVDLPTAGNMRPYLGAGYGVSWVEAEYNESVCFIYCFSTSNSVVDDSDRTEAWQAMIGASFGTSSPNREWYIGYRYYETDDLNFTTLSGVPFRQEGIQDHAFMAGFRFFID